MQPAAPEIFNTVLLARIVDAAGRALLPSDVKAIECSVCLPSHRHRGAPNALSQGMAHPVEAAEVFTTALRQDPAWSLDAIGYNFRHAIDLATVAPVGLRDSFQLRYDITTCDGRRSILRFHVRLHQHDRN